MHRDPTAAVSRFWLLLTIPLVLIGMVTAVLGLVLDDAYRHETADWLIQAQAQDAIDLVLGFPVLAVAAWFALRGSIAGTLIWLGALVNIAYASIIYSFDVQFGPLFLSYVATLSLSVWCLAGGLFTLDRTALQSRGARAPRWIGALLVLIASTFTLMWLGQIIPAMIDGAAPQEVNDLGLPTNPVHVIDLAFMLPATFVAGIALLRRRPASVWLAPIILTALALISAGILTIMGFQIADGESSAIGPATAISLLTIAILIATRRSLEPARNKDHSVARRTGDAHPHRKETAHA
jgi:hypothetical protein